MAISIQAVPRTLVEAKAYIGSKVIRRTDRLIDSTQSLGAVPSRALELGEVVGVVVKCEQTGKGHKGRPDGISVIIRYTRNMISWH